MNWYRENRWLGNFLLAFGAAAIFALWFLFHSKSVLAEALAQFDEVATERVRLEHLNPFPNEDNFHKTQVALENYGAALNKIREELKSHVVPAQPLAPNEFQSRLRQAILSTTERARTNRVKLPESFYLGFDEFVAALPANEKEAQLLGQELQQIELLIAILVDAKVDGITALKRAIASSAEPGASPVGQKASTAVPIVFERAVVDLTFTASPSAMRKVLNQIVSSDRQFFIVRALQVRNEQPKGPPRESSTTSPAASAGATTPAGALKFIVGNEHLGTAAKIEMVRLNF
jgi:hypothetical protein